MVLIQRSQLQPFPARQKLEKAGQALKSRAGLAR
jgi:hypothetical protein